MKGIFLVILKPTFEHFLIKLLLKCYFWDTFLTKIHRRKILILQNSGQILSKMIVLNFFLKKVTTHPRMKTRIFEFPDQNLPKMLIFDTFLKKVNPSS